MRVWDISVKKLCNKHLIAQHFEIHCIMTYLTTPKGGSYKKHPEVLRWKNRLPALHAKHTETVEEMYRRGYNHNSYLSFNGADTRYQRNKQVKFLQSKQEQINILKSKPCNCFK